MEKASCKRGGMSRQTTTIRLGGSSLLERSAVSDAAHIECAKRLNEFAAFCAHEELPVTNVMELERAALEYFDRLYLEGRRVDSGTRLIVALGA